MSRNRRKNREQELIEIHDDQEFKTLISNHGLLTAEDLIKIQKVVASLKIDEPIGEKKNCLPIGKTLKSRFWRNLITYLQIGECPNISSLPEEKREIIDYSIIDMAQLTPNERTFVSNMRNTFRNDDVYKMTFNQYKWISSIYERFKKAKIPDNDPTFELD
jgi:hypothetical protein